jgi:hypothetical protein
MFEDLPDSNETTSSNDFSEQWNSTEISTWMYYMEHICQPQTSFAENIGDSIYQHYSYQLALQGIKVTDDACSNYQRTKLIPFLKKVQFILNNNNQMTFLIDQEFNNYNDYSNQYYLGKCRLR